MEEFLSNEEWARFLNTDLSASAESSESLPTGSTPEVILTPDVLQVAAEVDSVYEDIDVSGFNTETDRAASSPMLVEQSG